MQVDVLVPGTENKTVQRNSKDPLFDVYRTQTRGGVITIIDPTPELTEELQDQYRQSAAGHAESASEKI